MAEVKGVVVLAVNPKALGNEAPAPERAPLAPPDQPLPPGAPPKMRTQFPCPAIPDNLACLQAPIASPEWCACVDSLISWLETEGAKILRWVQVQRPITDLRFLVDNGWNPEAAPPAWRELSRQAKAAVMAILTFARDTYDTIYDIIKCAFYWTTGITPVRNKIAYSVLLCIRNIIEWIRTLRLGSPDYLAVQVQLSLSLPQLERIVERMLQYLTTAELPGASEAIEAWLRQRIPDEQRDCLLRLHGLNPSLMKPFIMARSEQVPLEMWLRYYRRFGITGGLVDNAIRASGVIDPLFSRIFQEMQWEMPTVGDVLHFLQRNVFNQEYVEKYKLMDGFEERFWTRYGTALQDQGMRKETAADHYAAHWIMPSPEQMKEMIYRLRPGRVPANQVFTVDDYRRILQEQDYNALAVDWFAGIARPVPALGYIRDMYTQRIINDDELVAYHQDLGYTEDDSKRFLAVDRAKRARQRASQYVGFTPAYISKALAMGQMPEQLARVYTRELGMTDSEFEQLKSRGAGELQYKILTRARSKLLTTTITLVKEQLSVGTMTAAQGAAALQGVGWPAQAAIGIANLELAAARTARIKLAVGAVKKAYMKGEISIDRAGTMLDSIGITIDARTGYLNIWALENTPDRKRRTATQIIKDVADGVLSNADATARLLALGYNNADTLLFLHDANKDMINSIASIKVAEQLAGSGRVKELIRTVGAAQGVSKRVVKALEQEQPVAKLTKWMCHGVVKPHYVVSMMRLYGYTDDAIQHHIKDAAHSKTCEVDLSSWSIDQEDFTPLWIDTDETQSGQAASGHTADSGASGGSNGAGAGKAT